MNFILNLVSFLLIAVGLFFLVGVNSYEKNYFNDIPDDKKYQVEIILAKLSLISFFCVVLGMGIIVARIFS